MFFMIFSMTNRDFEGLGKKNLDLQSILFGVSRWSHVRNGKKHVDVRTCQTSSQIRQIMILRLKWLSVQEAHHNFAHRHSLGSPVFCVTNMPFLFVPDV